MAGIGATGWKNDGSFLEMMMLQQSREPAVSGQIASAGCVSFPAATPIPSVAAGGAPPPAVLSAAEQIAARINAKNKEREAEGRKRKFSETTEIDRKFTESPDTSQRPGPRPPPSSALIRQPEIPEEEHEEEQLVTTAWGRVYKAGDVPKSSHVGNLLPEEELQKYTTLLPGQQPKPQETKETIKIDSSNIGHKMLSKMGWKAGKGLGANESGKVAPVAVEQGVAGRSGILAGDMNGLGGEHTWDLKGNEDMFEQFRKRNMLGYRYRPNPNNNPRKLYY